MGQRERETLPVGLAFKRRLDVGMDTTKNEGEMRVRPGWQDEGERGAEEGRWQRARHRAGPRQRPGWFFHLLHRDLFRFYHVPRSMNSGETQPAVGRTGSVFAHLTRAQQVTCSLLTKKEKNRYSIAFPLAFGPRRFGKRKPQPRTCSFFVCRGDRGTCTLSAQRCHSRWHRP